MEEVNKIFPVFPRTFHELADSVSTVPLAPYLISVHYCLVALTLRKRPGAQEYAHEHPLASWFVCVVSCFGGSIISNFIMAQPILDIFQMNSANVVLITIFWYAILFSPFDAVYKITNLKMLKALLLVLKEVHRIRQILNGINKVAKMYPTSKNVFFTSVLIGCIRGSGAKFLLRPIDSFIRGNIFADNEFLQPTFSTKHSVVSSILIILQRQGVINIPEAYLVMYLFVFAAIVQLAILLFDMRDPYSMIEHLVAVIFLRKPRELRHEETKKKTD